MGIVLYQYPGGDGIGSVSPPCFKVDLALRLLRADFEVANLRSPKEVQRVSRTRRLPAIELDGRLVHDSIRILDELETRFDAPWLDASEAERIHDRLWETVINEHLYWCGFSLRWVDPEYSARFFKALFGRAPAATRMLFKVFFLPRQRKRSRLHGSGYRGKDELLAEMRRAIDMLVSDIGKGPFLQGRSTPGRGDLAAASILGQAGFRGSMPDVHRLVSTRPELMASMRATFAACGGESPRWLDEEAASVG
jgi:glutathione S-transferase